MTKTTVGLSWRAEGRGPQKGSRGRLGGECLNDSVDRDGDVDVSVVVVVVHLISHLVNV